MKVALLNVVVALVMVTVGLAGCGQEDAPAPRPVAPSAPAAMVVDADRDGLVFRYLAPGSGAVETATAWADVPEASRRRVIVYDTLAPPPPGWSQVADLSAGLPVTTAPLAGSVFQVAAATTEGGTPPPRRRVASGQSKEVVMFSTQGCGYCRKARKFLAKHRVPYTELDLETDPKANGRLADLGKRAGVPSQQLQGVPIIFVDEHPIIGWNQGQLAKLLGI